MSGKKGKSGEWDSSPPIHYRACGSFQVFEIGIQAVMVLNGYGFGLGGRGNYVDRYTKHDIFNPMETIEYDQFLAQTEPHDRGKVSCIAVKGLRLNRGLGEKKSSMLTVWGIPGMIRKG
jgi:hypothetical protein